MYESEIEICFYIYIYTYLSIYIHMCTHTHTHTHCFSGGSVVKNPLPMQEMWVQSWVRKITWRRKWQPTLVSCLENPTDRDWWGHKKSDKTERAHTHTHTHNTHMQASPMAEQVKNPPAIRRCRFDPWIGKIIWSRKWQPTPVFLPA